LDYHLYIRKPVPDRSFNAAIVTAFARAAAVDHRSIVLKAEQFRTTVVSSQDALKAFQNLFDILSSWSRTCGHDICS